MSRQFNLWHDFLKIRKKNLKCSLQSYFSCWGIFCEIVPIWMSVDLTDDKSVMVQAMVWCRQVTNHYLNQCWPSSASSNGATRPQCVKSITFEKHVSRKYFNDWSFAQSASLLEVSLEICWRLLDPLPKHHHGSYQSCLSVLVTPHTKK